MSLRQFSGNKQSLLLWIHLFSVLRVKGCMEPSQVLILRDFILSSWSINSICNRNKYSKMPHMCRFSLPMTQTHKSFTSGTCWDYIYVSRLHGSHIDTHSIQLWFFQRSVSNYTAQTMTHGGESVSVTPPVVLLSNLLSSAAFFHALRRCTLWNTPWLHQSKCCMWRVTGLLILANPPARQGLIQ